MDSSVALLVDNVLARLASMKPRNTLEVTRSPKLRAFWEENLTSAPKVSATRVQLKKKKAKLLPDVVGTTVVSVA